MYYNFVSSLFWRRSRTGEDSCEFTLNLVDYWGDFSLDLSLMETELDNSDIFFQRTFWILWALITAGMESKLWSLLICTMNWNRKPGILASFSAVSDNQCSRSFCSFGTNDSIFWSRVKSFEYQHITDNVNKYDLLSAAQHMRLSLYESKTFSSPSVSNYY